MEDVVSKQALEPIIKEEHLKFLPSISNLTPREQRELRGLIFDLTQTNKLEEFLTLFSMATMISIEGTQYNAHYELGQRDAIINLRNLVTEIKKI